MVAKLDTVVDKLVGLPRQMGDTVGSEVVQQLSTVLESFAQKISSAPIHRQTTLGRPPVSVYIVP